MSRFVAMFDGVCQPNGGVGEVFLTSDCTMFQLPDNVQPNLREFVTCSGKQLKSGDRAGKVEDYDSDLHLKRIERERVQRW